MIGVYGVATDACLLSKRRHRQSIGAVLQPPVSGRPLDQPIQCFPEFAIGIAQSLFQRLRTTSNAISRAMANFICHD